MRSGLGSSQMGFRNVSIRGTAAFGESGTPRSARTGLAILSKRLFLVHMLEDISQGNISAQAGFQVERVGRGEGLRVGAPLPLCLVGGLKAQGELSPHIANPEKADRPCSFSQIIFATLILPSAGLYHCLLMCQALCVASGTQTQSVINRLDGKTGRKAVTM